MDFRPHSAEEGLLSWVERWAPDEAEIWARWRQSLSAEQRTAVLLPLQAALCGLMAFRHLENHPPTSSSADFTPHLHAMHASCTWALELARKLGAAGAPERPMRRASGRIIEPQASLDALAGSLRDALRVGERWSNAARVDAGAFSASCDLFLRDIDRNRFFRPSDPLEFSNVTELIGSERFPPHLVSLGHGAAKTTTTIAFLSMLRSHRYLGIADGQMGERDGVFRAHIVLAGARRELRTLARFLLVQGGEGVEALAASLQDTVRAGLREPLPGLDDERGLAAPSERLRNAIREVRRTVKSTAKQLRDLASPLGPERAERTTERVKIDLRPEIWSFRFIVRGFVAKASAARPRVDRSYAAADLAFAAEFVRHFRVFGPRLAKGTDYGRRASLIRAVSALSRRDEVDKTALDFAVGECVRFVEHLDQALEERHGSPGASFDKARAAAELRDYLTSARDRPSSSRAPVGAFGRGHAEHAEAS